VGRAGTMCLIYKIDESAHIRVTGLRPTAPREGELELVSVDT